MAFGDCKSWDCWHAVGCAAWALEGARCLMQERGGGAGRTIKYKASQHLSFS